jgi:site-specific DNA-methyltransferase (adenine-specific)
MIGERLHVLVSSREGGMDKNLLYYGDNLGVLRRQVKDESVDLVYLDPPFNSNATYNVLFAEQNGARVAIIARAAGGMWSSALAAVWQRRG